MRSLKQLFERLTDSSFVFPRPRLIYDDERNNDDDDIDEDDDHDNDGEIIIKISRRVERRTN